MNSNLNLTHDAAVYTKSFMKSFFMSYVFGLVTILCVKFIAKKIYK